MRRRSWMNRERRFAGWLTRAFRRQSNESNDFKPVSLRGARKHYIRNHKMMASRPVVAPDLGGCQLQSVGCPEFVNSKEFFGVVANIVAGLDFIPGAPETAETFNRLPQSCAIDFALANQSIESAAGLNGTCLRAHHHGSGL